MSLKIIAAAFLLALPAAGAEPPLPTLRIEPTAGGSIFYVKNVSSIPLTAYVIELVDYPGSSYALFQDEITSQPIAPEKEKRIQVSNMTVGAVPDYVKLRAAIYADGTTAGLPEKIAQLLARRQFTLDTVRDVIRRVELGQQTKTPKDTLTANLRQAIEFMTLPPGFDKSSQVAINQSAGRAVLTEAAGYLDMHSPEDTITRYRGLEKTLADSKPRS